jgi:hypothetical protein
MSLSPGLVHSCSELLSLINRRAVSLLQIRASFTSIGVIPIENTIDYSQRMNWLLTNDAGLAEVTRSGNRLLSSEPIHGRMRQALLDIIEIDRPVWIQNAIQGRRQVLDFVSTAIAQVFLEAGLVDGTSPDVVAFWDTLAQEARGQRNSMLLQIGREGERLSIAYETARTGRTPRWVAIDNNADGFDLLSVVSDTSTQKLSIEVKATTVGTSAVLHMTRNEWDYALGARTHVFHLWDMTSPEPRLAVLQWQDIGDHIPTDNQDGLWQQATIPFNVFESKMSAQAGLTANV